MNTRMMAAVVAITAIIFPVDDAAVDWGGVVVVVAAAVVSER